MNRHLVVTKDPRDPHPECETWEYTASDMAMVLTLHAQLGRPEPVYVLRTAVGQ